MRLELVVECAYDDGNKQASMNLTTPPDQHDNIYTDARHYGDDEFDAVYDEDEEELIQKMSDDTYLVEGSMKLDDINDALGTNLTSEDYDSIGGLIIDCLDRLPEDGEEVTLENGIHLKVQGIDQNRIVKVLMTIPEVPEEHDAGTAEISEDHE